MMTFPTVSGKSFKIPWFQSPPTSFKNIVIHHDLFFFGYGSTQACFTMISKSSWFHGFIPHHPPSIFWGFPTSVGMKHLIHR
jgi:hypothetical protein